MFINLVNDVVLYYDGITYAKDIESSFTVFILFVLMSIFLGIILPHVFHHRWQEGTFIKPLSVNKTMLLIGSLGTLIWFFSREIGIGIFNAYLLQFFP